MTAIELQIHITRNGKPWINPQNIELLCYVGTTGSLRNTALKMGISYHKVWMMLEKINQAYNEPLVVKTRGGKNGGGAVITDTGRLVLQEYRAIESYINNVTNQLNTEIHL